jgi:AcrR family transcriptional regulator
LIAHQQGSKRPSGGETRRRILAAALERFSSQGYAGTSIRDIATSTGMTTAALYHHFDSKEHILAAVIEPMRTEMRQLVEATPDVPETVATLVDILSRHGPLLRIFFHDSSSAQLEKSHLRSELLTPVVALLAGDEDPANRLRARCAIGAIQFGVLGAIMANPSFQPPLSGDVALRLVDHTEHVLDADERRLVAEAALRALGPPCP